MPSKTNSLGAFVSNAIAHNDEHLPPMEQKVREYIKENFLIPTGLVWEVKAKPAHHGFPGGVEIIQRWRLEHQDPTRCRDMAGAQFLSLDTLRFHHSWNVCVRGAWKDLINQFGRTLACIDESGLVVGY